MPRQDGEPPDGLPLSLRRRKELAIAKVAPKLVGVEDVAEDEMLELGLNV